MCCNVRFVSQVFTVQPYFVVSAKIRLIRISARNICSAMQPNLNKNIRLRGLGTPPNLAVLSTHCGQLILKN